MPKPPSRSTRPARWVNQDVSSCQPQAGPSREQGAKERAQAVAKIELPAGTPPPPMVSGKWVDVDVLDLDDEQMHAILGGSPTVTPQTAEDVL
ncbi:hypothetical protein NDU88_001401 [Pleurodeles waltl]|uniref:Uncharacterized protein n=1 Tax=Pleurodeles waltl TaxID=8319 RepID=A0AAV7THP7_PLEWA|nr:hypothetical protein NDU88_001401 [Pleurodeles waltl]